MAEWRWIHPVLVHQVHDMQLAEHGGMAGVRDANAVESALARPQQLAHYGTPDAADLAATYAYGLARNHGFADGNKRTAWVLARIFLADNGYTLTFETLNAIRIVEKLAAGELTQDELAAWFRERLTTNP